jgi:8-oxo-dGTP diphosphatase
MQIGLIVSTLIVNNKGEVLILQRSKSEDVLPEYWDFPGGTLEEGEDPVLGAIRETKEETGINIVKPELFFYHSIIDEPKNKQFVTLIFKVRVDNIEVILNKNDHQKYLWINPGDVGKYNTVHNLKECILTHFSKSPIF